MKPTLAVYANEDDALLLWTVDALDPGCRGFAIQRERNGGAAEWLDNYAPPGLKSHQAGRHQGSDQWPVRAFTWTDHEVDSGDTVRYRVVPVTHGPQLTHASRWSKRRTLASTGAYFNRGFVISQFMSRYLDQHYPGLTRDQALRKFKADIGTQLDDRIRAFLAGGLRTRMLELLKEPGDVYAALFELSDEELLRGLEALGARLHIVLANGSVQSVKGVPVAEARKGDENAAARKRLVASGAEVHDRFVSPGALAHNKFLVAGDKVWTGSTNWTPTGLCTQLNNGVLIEDAALAAGFKAQWEALRDAKGDHPRPLAAANATPSGNAHFTRAKSRADLTALQEIVAAAKQGVLFLMFIPGDAGVLKDIRELAARPEIVLRGVVSELPRGRADESSGPTTRLKVTLFGEDGESTRLLDVIQPQGMKHTAAWWAEEVTRAQFLGDVGHAIVHSKVLVVDPFTDPVVVTGSHNFSVSASEHNDENFVVIRGDKALAEAYAVNVANAWRHYAVRAATAHAELSGIDYLQALLQDRRGDEAFWGLSRA